jgi:hypothetical protein
MRPMRSSPCISCSPDDRQPAAVQATTSGGCPACNAMARSQWGPCPQGQVSVEAISTPAFKQRRTTRGHSSCSTVPGIILYKDNGCVAHSLTICSTVVSQQHMQLTHH